MKKEYDFTHAEQGKFYVPAEEIEAPIYLEKDVAEFLHQKLKGKKTGSNIRILFNNFHKLFDFIKK